VGIGLIGLTSQFILTFAALLMSAHYLSTALHYSPLRLGLSLTVFAVLMVPLALGAPITARYLPRGIAVAFGMLALGVGFVLLAHLDARSGFAPFAIAAAVIGAGIGLAQVPATESVIESLPRHAQGVASAVNDVTREFGAAFGIAISGAVLQANAGHSGSPAADLMHGWSASCLTLAGIGFLSTVGVLMLHRRTAHSHSGEPTVIEGGCQTEPPVDTSRDHAMGATKSTGSPSSAEPC
jgi:hypothetical protein